MSQRRACQVLSIDRSSARYRSVRSDDAAVRAAMKAVAAERRRFGYRCIHIMLERQGRRCCTNQMMAAVPLSPDTLIPGPR